MIGEQRFDVGVFGGWEIRFAVEDRHGVTLCRIFGKSARILNSGIPCADNYDMFVNILGGIIELVLDMRQVHAGTAHLVWIALRANTQDDILRLYRLTIGQLYCKGRFVPLHLFCRSAAIAGAHHDSMDAAFNRRANAPDCLGFGIIYDVDLILFGLLVPLVQDHFALASIEIAVRTEHQIAGRRHHMLALLVFVDRIGKVIGLFDQHMAHAQLSRACSCAQSGRSGTNYGNAVAFRHPIPPLV